MKKLILYLVKYFNDFTNHKMSPEQEAQSILNYMLLKSNTSDTAETFKALESKLHFHLRELDKYHEKQRRIINDFIPREKSIINIMVNDPIFEQPIKN